MSDVPSIKVEPKSGRGHCSEVMSKSSPQAGIKSQMLVTKKTYGRHLIYTCFPGVRTEESKGVNSRNMTDASFSALKRKRELERSQMVLLLKPQMRDN